jgi:hypothetical protein
MLLWNQILKKFPYELKNARTMENVLICKSYKKKFDIGKPFDLFLWNHIIINKPNMNYFLKLNKIGKHLIAPHLTFTQIFQLHGYGQYGLHGNIINVLMNLNIIHIVLPCYYYYSFSFFFLFFVLWLHHQ